jgi:hypothetical protein
MTAKGLLGHRDSPQRIRDYCATLKLNLAAGDHTQVLICYCYLNVDSVLLRIFAVLVMQSVYSSAACALHYACDLKQATMHHV